MNILISGINGYIGSKLCLQLLSEGHLVNGIVRKENTISEKLGVKVYQADIRQPLSLQAELKYDFFVHLAAANDVDSSDHKSAFEVTALGTRNCLQFCKDNHIPNFIYFSTFQVYGELEGAFTEQSPKAPNNDYGLTHLFAEEYVKLFHRKFKMNYLILRPTNIFGPPLYSEIDRWSLVPGCFCKEAIERSTITLLSSGLQERDFVDLDDLVEFSSKTIEGFESIKNREINVSSGDIYSILDIAKEVKKVADEMLGTSIALHVKSDSPSKANQFKITRSEIEKIPFSFKHKRALTIAINQTLKLLKGQHA